MDNLNLDCLFDDSRTRLLSISRNVLNDAEKFSKRHGFTLDEWITLGIDMLNEKANRGKIKRR